MIYPIEIRRGLSAEFFKFKNTFLFWFVILAPAFVPFINLISFLRRGEDIMARGGEAWPNLIQYNTGPSNLLLPFFIFILALYVNNIETSSNTWKLIYSQPISRLSVYISKLSSLLIMLFLSLMLFGIFIYASGILINYFKPSLGFDTRVDIVFLFGRCLKIYFATLGIAVIHFYISQRSKSILLPLGIGIGGLISFSILVQGWEYAQYHPYGYHILTLGSANGSRSQLLERMTPIYLSFTITTCLSILGAIDIKRKRIF